MSLIRSLFVSMAALSLSACATLMGGDETTWISSEPAFVQCELVGTGFRKVVRTPGEVSLPKQATPVRVSCHANGYYDTEQSLKTRIDPMIAANFVIGSSLGAVVDLISGAAMKYPARVKIHLEPESFASEAERDEWYGRYRRVIERRWNDLITDLEITCNRDHDSQVDCLEEIKQAKAGSAKQLHILDQRRLLARIRSAHETDLAAN